MTPPAGDPATRTDGLFSLHKNEQRIGVVIGVVLMLGALISLGWSAWQSSDSAARAPEQQVQQRLEQLRTHNGDLFNGKMADRATTGPPLPALPQYAPSRVQPADSAPLSSPERFEAADTVHDLPPLLDEGPTIEAPNRLRSVAMLNIGNRGTRGTQQATTGGQSSWTIQLSGDGGGMPVDAGQKAADPGKPKVDAAQPAPAAQGTGAGQGAGAGPSTSAGQDTGGGQSAGAKQGAGGGESAGGGQGAGGGQAADAGGAPADNSQQAGSGNQGMEVINVKARDMQYDPSHATLHAADGELFMYANSSVDAQVTLDSQAQGLSITARGDKAKGEWPKLTVSIDGTPIGEVVVNSSVDKKFYLPISVAPGQMDVQLSYTNDYYDPVAQKDRNVYVSRVKVVAQGQQGQ